MSGLAMVQIAFALVPLGVVVLYTGAHHHDAGTSGVHTFNDDLDAGPLLALFALTMLLLTGGDAAFTLARDVVMVTLAVVVAGVVGLHAHLASPDAAWMRWPVGAPLVVVVVQLGIDLVRLRPVFAALRARRRLPRAVVRRV